MIPKTIIEYAAQDTGWNEASQLLVCLDFIEQMNKVEPDFERYVQSRVDKELDNFEEDERAMHQDELG